MSRRTSRPSPAGIVAADAPTGAGKRSAVGLLAVAAVRSVVTPEEVISMVVTDDARSEPAVNRRERSQLGLPEAILIAAGSAAGYLAAYAREYSFCRELRIPIVIVQFDGTRAILTLTAALVLMGAVTCILFPLQSLFRRQGPPSVTRRLARFIIPSVVVFWLIAIDHLWVAACVVVVVASLEQHTWRAGKKGTAEGLVSAKTASKMFSLVEAAGILYVTATLIGHLEAHSEEWPILQDHPNIVLLRRYGDRLAAAEVGPEGNAIIKHYCIGFDDARLRSGIILRTTGRLH